MPALELQIPRKSGEPLLIPGDAQQNGNAQRSEHLLENEESELRGKEPAEQVGICSLMIICIQFIRVELARNLGHLVAESHEDKGRCKQYASSRPAEGTRRPTKAKRYLTNSNPRDHKEVS